MKQLWFLAIVACGPPQATPIANTAPPQPHVVHTPAPTLNRELVHFEPGASTIQPGERAVLERVVRLMNADRSQMFQISGHADTGEADVSDARAAAVRHYLVARGIADHRLLVRGAGTDEPRADNDNRRVDFQRATVKTDITTGRRVVITGSDVEILDSVTFDGKVKLAAKSYPILDAVVATLQRDPSILLMEIQSHVDERGDDAANLKLTEARAKVVRDYLIAKGVDPARLTSQGYGETQPIDRGHDAAAWEKNNRVAFLIIKRQP